MKNNYTAYSAKIISLIASFGIALISFVAFMAVFPQAALVWGLLIGGGTFFIESRTYWHDVQKAFAVTFVKGIFANLENNLLARELLLDKRVQAILENQYTAITEKKAKKKLVKRAIEAWQKGADNDLLAQLPEGIIAKSRQAIRQELIIKKILRAVAVIASVANGLSFGATTFTHASIAFTKVLLLLSINPSVLMILIAAGIVALFAGIAYCNLMDRMLTKAIEKNIFRKLFHSLKKIFVPEEPLLEMNYKNLVFYMLRCGIVGGLFVIVLAASILATCASSGTLLSQNIEVLQACLNFFTNITTALQIITESLCAGLVYLFFLPTMLMFSFKNSWSIVRALAIGITDKIENPQKISNAIKNYIQAVRADPRELAKLPGYLLGISIGGVALIAHVIGEGAFAGEGLTDSANKFLGIFQQIPEVFDKITTFFNGLLSIGFQPAHMAAATEIAVEVLEHLPFLSGGHDHGAGFPEAMQNVSYKIILGSMPCCRSENNLPIPNENYNFQLFADENTPEEKEEPEQEGDIELENLKNLIN